MNDLLAAIPSDSQFRDDTQNIVEFLAAPDLEKLSATLIGRHFRFSDLANVKIVCLWKRSGGMFQSSPSYEAGCNLMDAEESARELAKG